MNLHVPQVQVRVQQYTSKDPHQHQAVQLMVVHQHNHSSTLPRSAQIPRNRRSSLSTPFHLHVHNVKINPPHVHIWYVYLPVFFQDKILLHLLMVDDL